MIPNPLSIHEPMLKERLNTTSGIIFLAEFEFLVLRLRIKKKHED